MAKGTKDGRKHNGGARQGAGRKPKREEDKLNNLFVEAVKRITKKDDDDEAKIDILVKLWETSARGQIFIAEHLFGKPKENVDVNVNNNYPDLSNLSNEELEKLINESEPKN